MQGHPPKASGLAPTADQELTTENETKSTLSAFQFKQSPSQITWYCHTHCEQIQKERAVFLENPDNLHANSPGSGVPPPVSTLSRALPSLLR